MEINNIILTITIISLCLYAYSKEKNDLPHIYTGSIPLSTDSKSKLLRKFQNCLLVNKRCIKWRRSYLSAVISTIFIFTIIYIRIPTIKELVLHILIIYIVYYAMWSNFTDTVSNEVETIGKNIIKTLNITKPKPFISYI